MEQNKKICLRCGHKWKSFVDDPVSCPRCKSPAWNKPRIRKSKSTWR